MKLIVVSKNHGKTRHLHLGGVSRALLSLCLLALPVSGAALYHHWLINHQGVVDAETAAIWRERLLEQESLVSEARADAERQLAAMTLRLGKLQARLQRLDALGSHITVVAKLDKGEFDFSEAPAVGGPESTSVSSVLQVDEGDLLHNLDSLAQRISDREEQLETLETLLGKRKLSRDSFVAGRPIKKGWLSSQYGYRIDPFKGHKAWHAGVDFAGKMGSDIVAVAAGVVTWSDERYGYGRMVEVNHGDGYVTRYAHNSDNKVKLGDVVKKGQVIALMGSSGRSTGPHVHFEVYKNGRTVNPADYLRRTHR